MATDTTASTSPTELDAGMMIRRALFLLLLFGLTYFYLAVDFRGLSHEKGMDQAQVAREIARGKGFNTRFIRPIAWTQLEKELHKKEDSQNVFPSLYSIPDTYNAPLNPILNSIFLGMASKTWKMDPKAHIYIPDIIISGVSMVLLMASIGVSYLLISRIFDPRIGGVTALLMLFCELLWRYSQSGLPQMLMLFLFSFATYFLFKAVENQQLGRPVYWWLVLTGGFFGLLAMSNWLTIWIFFGMLIFAAYYFTPRGLQILLLIGVFAPIALWWALANNMKHTGNPFGAALYSFYGGPGATMGESALMRDLDQSGGALEFRGFISRCVTNSIGQLRDFYALMGGVVAAPLFFLSLLHPFRRKEIADFRWCILLMWLFAVIAMTLWGLQSAGSEQTDPNNLHILFLPLFTGYGLALLAVLWNRLSLPLHIPIVRNGHFILAIAVSCLPFFANLPLRIRNSATMGEQWKCHAPNYIPRSLTAHAKSFSEVDVIASDIPWAVAWYMDRSSVWLPKTPQQLNRLVATSRESTSRESSTPTPIVAALVSPKLTYETPMLGVAAPQMEWFPWRGYVMVRVLMSAFPTLQQDPGTLFQEYPFRQLQQKLQERGGGNYQIWIDPAHFTDRDTGVEETPAEE